MSGGQDDPDHILPFLDDLVDLPEPDTFQSDISLPDIHTNLGLTPVQSPPNLNNGAAQYLGQNLGQNQPSMSHLPENLASNLFSNSRHDSEQYPWDLYSPFSSQQPTPKSDSFQPPLPSNLSEFLPMNEAFFQRDSTGTATHFHSQNPSIEQFRASQHFNAHCHVPGQSGSIQSEFRGQCPPAFASSQDFLRHPDHFIGEGQNARFPCRASHTPSFEKPDPTKRRGRPRLYDTSIPSDQATQTSEPANSKEAVIPRRKRGAKPKYKYNTEAEAVAKRRERNRKTAISSYYKRKNRDSELEQEIQELEKEKEALYALSHLLQGPGTNREAIAAILEETNSGMQTLELLNQPK